MSPPPRYRIAALLSLLRLAAKTDWIDRLHVGVEPAYGTIEVINAVANYWKHEDDWPTREVAKDGRLKTRWDTLGLRPPATTITSWSESGYGPGASSVA